MDKTPLTNVPNTDERDGDEASRENSQSTEPYTRPFDDGSDDSQNVDEDSGAETHDTNANTFSERDQLEDEPASEIFRIDAAPPSFGFTPSNFATLNFHEPTDLKWDPNSDDNVSSPKRDGSDDSENEFMAPPASLFTEDNSDDHVEYTTNEKSLKKDGSDDSTTTGDVTSPTKPRVHQKGKESNGNVVSKMSFFDKFGVRSEPEQEEEEVPVNVSMMKNDESIDAFMTPPEKSQPKVHRKGKESYGNVTSETSFFARFSSETNDAAPVRDVRSTPSMRDPDPVPDSKISTLVSHEEVKSIPTHRQKQASVGFAISDLSFSQKYIPDDNGDPPPPTSVTEYEPEEPHEDEASTSTISGNNENEEMEILRQEIQSLCDQLQRAQRQIDHQQAALSSTESELKFCRESKFRLIQSSSSEITRLKDVIGLLAKHQKQ